MEIDKPYLIIEIDYKNLIFLVVKYDSDSNFKIIYSEIICFDNFLTQKIINSDIFFETIKNNLKKIESKFDCIFETATIVIDPDETNCINISGFKKLNGSQILKKDISFILNENKKIILNSENNIFIVHLFNSRFSIDKNYFSNPPFGIHGDFYSQDMTFFTLDRTYIKNIRSILNNCNIDIERIILKSFANTVNFFLENKLENNSIIIRLSEKRSNISIFKSQSFIFSENFKFGTDMILKDVSKLCSLDFELVKDIIKNLPFEELSKNNNEEYLDKKYFQKIKYRKISLKLIFNIVSSRVDELFEIIYEKNINLNYLKKNNLNVYFTIDDKNLFNHLNFVFKKKFNEKFNIIFNDTFEDNSLSSVKGAAELLGKGWAKEAIPIIEPKKSAISRFFSNLFS